MKALRKMKKGKATGPDNITVDVWKSLGEEGIYMLWDLMEKIHQEENMPEEWRDSVIVPIYKEKGDIQECGNYRGVKLMSHTMKIWEKVIEGRLREETSIGEEQFGFMPGRGTTDATFTLRQTMEKHREKGKGLHCVYRLRKGVRSGTATRSVEVYEGKGGTGKVCKNGARHVRGRKN